MVEKNVQTCRVAGASVVCARPSQSCGMEGSRMTGESLAMREKRERRARDSVSAQFGRMETRVITCCWISWRSTA